MSDRNMLAMLATQGKFNGSVYQFYLDRGSRAHRSVSIVYPSRWVATLP